jgi:hypothetical protein
VRRIAAAAILAALAAAGTLSAQQISNLEAGRPMAMEDARAIETGAFSFSLAYEAARREDRVDYSGPSVSLVYGFANGLEAGAETRVLTSPRLNASRGLSSGDLDVHVLGVAAEERGNRPAVAFRADLFLPTGFASHGTNVSGEAILTKSFDRFRLHGGFTFLYVGDTRPGERRRRFRAVVGADAPLAGPWNTDTLLLADVVLAQSVRTVRNATVTFEAGIRRRIGMQTLLQVAALASVAGERTRTRFGGSIGITHAF